MNLMLSYIQESSQVRPSALYLLAPMYPFTNMVGLSTAHYYPDQPYASPDEAEWFDPWNNLPLPKHAPMPEGTAFSQAVYSGSDVAGYAEQRRPSSSYSYSTLSTPGLSWRDSSCSPLSACFDDPTLPSAPNADAISFSAVIDSTSQHLTSSPHSAYTSQPAAPYAFEGAQEEGCSTYMLEPNSSLTLPSVEEILACEAEWPSMFLDGERTAIPPSVAAEPSPPAPPHAYPLSSYPAAAPELPELQHPRPWRPYVPPWQTATDFDLEQFVAPQSALGSGHLQDASSCQAGPSWVGPSQTQSVEVEYGHKEDGEEEEEEEEGEDSYMSEEELEELMDFEWTGEDQGIFTQAQPQNLPPHGYVSGPTSYFSAAMLPPVTVYQNFAQILPPDSLLYQPLHSSVTSNVWTPTDPHLSACAH